MAAVRPLAALTLQGAYLVTPGLELIRNGRPTPIVRDNGGAKSEIPRSTAHSHQLDRTFRSSHLSQFWSWQFLFLAGFDHF
jgi:hypothetical protein